MSEGFCRMRATKAFVSSNKLNDSIVRKPASTKDSATVCLVGRLERGSKKVRSVKKVSILTSRESEGLRTVWNCFSGERPDFLFNGDGVLRDRPRRLSREEEERRLRFFLDFFCFRRLEEEEEDRALFFLDEAFFEFSASSFRIRTRRARVDNEVEASETAKEGSRTLVAAAT